MWSQISKDCEHLRGLSKKNPQNSSLKANLSGSANDQERKKDKFFLETDFPAKVDCCLREKQTLNKKQKKQTSAFEVFPLSCHPYASYPFIPMALILTALTCYHLVV